MMSATGTCTNYRECSIADSGTAVELYAGPGEYCPECGTKLKLSERRDPPPVSTSATPAAQTPPVAVARRMFERGRLWLVIAAVAAVVLVAAIVFGVRALVGAGRPELAVCGYGQNASRLSLDLVQAFFRNKGASRVDASGNGERTTFSAHLPGRSTPAHADVVSVGTEHGSSVPDPSACPVRVLAGAVAEGGGQTTEIARDGVVVIVNPANPVTALDLNQLWSVLIGNVKTWAAVGGPNAPINVVLPDPQSEESVVLRSGLLRLQPGLALDPALWTRTARPPGTSTITDVVASAADRNAIGVTTFRTAEPAKVLKIIGKGGFELVPSALSIAQSTYPLLLHFYLTSSQPATPLATDFVSFIHSQAGHDAIVNAGFVPNVQTRD